jgi:hypothetical protein
MGLWDYQVWLNIKAAGKNPWGEFKFSFWILLAAMLNTWGMGFNPSADNIILWAVVSSVAAFMLCFTTLAYCCWYLERTTAPIKIELPLLPSVAFLFQTVLRWFMVVMKIVLHPQRLRRTKSHNHVLQMPSLCPRAPTV